MTDNINSAHGKEQNIKMNLLKWLNEGKDPYSIIYELAKYLETVSSEPGYADIILNDIRTVYGIGYAAFAGGRFPGCFCFGLPGLQVDDKYCEEGQADLFCHLLRDSRCHNAHIKLKSPPCVGERLITPEINKRKILSCTILSPSLPGRG